MKVTIFLSVLVLGVVARPSEEPSIKFPKKYDPSIHAQEAKKKVSGKEENTNGQSSYATFHRSELMDDMIPPPSVYQRLYYDDFSRNIPRSYPEGFVYDASIGDLSGFLVVPPEDSYLSPDGVPLEGLVPPSEGKGIVDEPQTYVSYNQGNTEDRVPLSVPDPSSYAIIPSETKLSFSNMRPPPDQDGAKVSYSSYINYKRPSE